LPARILQVDIIVVKIGIKFFYTCYVFKNAFVPGTQLKDRLEDLWSTYGRRPLALCRLDGGPWTRLPDVSGRVDDALLNVTHLRIYFPFWDEPLKP